MTLMAFGLALITMQGAGVPAPTYTDVATAEDGTVYAVDTAQIRQRMSDGEPLRTASVRVTFSPTADAGTAEVVRGYRIRCGAATAALHTTLSTERGTGRVSMASTKLAELDYRQINAMDPAEKSAIAYICAAPL